MSAALELGFEHAILPGRSGATLLLLHGTGGDEHQLLDLGRQLAPEATLLSPRGQVLENGFVRRFFRRHGPLDLDIPDLLARTDELAEFIATACLRYELDPRRIMALGYSNGANIAVSLLLRHPGTLAGAALLRATLPYPPDEGPHLDGRPVLVLDGERDPYVPRDRYNQLVETLEAAGAALSAELLPAGHELQPGELDRVRRWLADRTRSGWR